MCNSSKWHTIWSAVAIQLKKVLTLGLLTLTNCRNSKLKMPTAERLMLKLRNRTSQTSGWDHPSLILSTFHTEFLIYNILITCSIKKNANLPWCLVLPFYPCFYLKSTKVKWPTMQGYEVDVSANSDKETRDTFKQFSENTRWFRFYARSWFLKSISIEH